MTGNERVQKKVKCSQKKKRNKEKLMCASPLSHRAKKLRQIVTVIARTLSYPKHLQEEKKKRLRMLSYHIEVWHTEQKRKKRNVSQQKRGRSTAR